MASILTEYANNWIVCINAEALFPVPNIVSFSYVPKFDYLPIHQLCRPKTLTRGEGGLCCRKYVDHSFSHAHFCIYGNNVLVKPVYVKILKEVQSKCRVAAFCFY